jgi:exoribonuclease R
MQYYKEFMDDSFISSDKNILTGIYKNIENNSYIEIEKDKYIDIENNRAINNDIVYYINNKIVSLKKRNIIDIVGILYIDSKIKYGNINDKSLYLFKPTNKSYPNFYIPYKIKNNRNKIFCTIQFKEWKITDKLPIGTLINIIGNISDKDSEIEHMRIYYGINNNTWKIDNNKKNDDIKIIDTLQEKTEDYEVFSIDPIGSKDIDDAFHFKNINDDSFENTMNLSKCSRLDKELFSGERSYSENTINLSKCSIDDKELFSGERSYSENTINLSKCSIDDKELFSGERSYSENTDSYEVGIHIASPMNFFENNYIEILDRISTVYLPNKKYNMLPNIYADDIISLLENKKRFALSLILKINNNVVISYEIKETIVKNIKTYDYDTFDKVFKKNKKLIDFMNLTKIFFKVDSIDSHKLVEYWMIYTNKFIAKYLINNNYSNIILRSHKLNIKNKELELDDSLNNYLSLKEESSAQYVIYDKDNLNQCHSKLDNEYYTHFTSPIRRSVDFYIQLLLLNKIKHIKKDELLDRIDKINIFTKNCRKFDRTIRRLNFLYDIKESNRNIETFGYIICITKNKLTVYIPEYNLEENIIIVPYKFSNSYDIVTSVDINNNINKISCTCKNISEYTKTYTLYEKINIKLWVFTSFENIFDKLKIEIM